MNNHRGLRHLVFAGPLVTVFAGPLVTMPLVTTLYLQAAPDLPARAPRGRWPVSLVSVASLASPRAPPTFSVL